jgi:hypothetical protein
MSNFWGGILAVTGLMACPCHLPITLPLILGLLGGTGLGTFIGANSNLVYGLAIGYFIVGMAGGVYLLNRRRRSIQGTSCEISNQRNIVKSYKRGAGTKF